jgi:sulfoxide reductase heme-binding subunit YedZ
MSLFSSSQALWYFSRGSGTVSMVLLTASSALGIVTRGGRPLPGLPRFVIGALHRNASLLALVFLCLHIFTAIADSFVPLGLLDAIVPFHTSYHPIEVGLGAIGFDLILALIVTSLLRERLGRRVWRLIHWTAYLCWPVAMVHSTLLGPDILDGLLVWLTVVCIAVFAVSVGWRLKAIRPDGAQVAARQSRARQA